MSIECLGNFSLSCAEEYLAELWIRLERDDIPTPEIRCDFEPNGTVTLWRNYQEASSSGSGGTVLKK
jgi:hypothetical protein